MGANGRSLMGKKKAKTDEAPKEEAVPAWIEELVPLQKKMAKLQHALDEKISEAATEHQKAVMPLYAARNDVVDKVPGFWLKAFQGHPLLHQVLSDRDVEIMGSLKRFDMEMEDLDAKVEGGESNSMKITLTFAENEFFSNKTISKTVISHNGPSEEGEGEYEVESDEIEWKEVNKGKSKGKKRPADEDSIFEVFDGEKYNDDTFLDPLRELYMDAEAYYMVDPATFAHGCDDEDCEDNDCEDC